jgi:hypothetical protein
MSTQPWIVLASTALERDAAGLVAGRLAMLGFVALVMLGVVAFFLYLRKQAKNPSQEASELESLTQVVEEEEDDDASWR